MNKSVNTLLLGRRWKKVLRAGYSKLRHKYGLAQMDVELLQYFGENPGSMASDAIRDLDINKGNVSTALFNLYREGYVDGREKDTDLRAVEYYLKEKGRKIAKEADAIRDEMLDALFRGVSEQELESLERISEKLRANLDEQLRA